MAKNKDKKHRQEQAEVAEAPVEEMKVEEQPLEEKKKYYYNPVTAKAYRDKIKQFAVAGGYMPKERHPGAGTTVKKTSKTGKEYYYQPWSSLTPEQKTARLAQARDRMARDRADAAKYRAEHPEEKS